jgi:hypothetical protein
MNWLAVSRFVGAALLTFLAVHAHAAEVVVYTSVDDVFARPVTEQFQNQTGIEVKLVPDTEETKSWLGEPPHRREKASAV